MKSKKRALLKSLIALLLCLSMLVGTTFAWFTDSVSTGLNTIAAGNLDVELYHTNAATRDEKVDASTDLFLDLQGEDILWEPGVVSYENLRVVNEGDLALAYQMSIATANENHVVDPSGAIYGLSQILKVGVVEGGITATDRAGVVASVGEGNWITLGEFLRSGSLLPQGDAEAEDTWGIVIYWQPGENDNFWNLNNGKVLDQGEALQIDLGINLIATQEVYESDSFGSDYDTSAKADVFPEFVGGSASAPVVPDGNNCTTEAITMTSGDVTAVVPAGVQLAPGTTQLTLTVTEMEATGSNVQLNAGEAMRSLDVHIEGIDPANTAPITVALTEVVAKGLNMGNYKLYHVENGTTNEMTLVDSAADFSAHNQFKYDPATGNITLYMASFSEVALVAEPAKWEGEFDYSWYTNAVAPADSEATTEYIIANADQLAGFGAIVGGMNGKTQDSFAGKTVKLISDINLGDKESENNPDIIFYPIGYYNSEGTYERTNTAITSGLRNFEGTFDGNGHTIANFYQNTWEMKGDNEYYDRTLQYFRDGMGLFGRVYGGTVKNLTVKNFKSDGEYTTTGVIAAYADGATFENIAIFNCNPRVYNIGNGGIVGCVGWYAKEANLKTTFKNITVDNSNKISALWGSYDVACGGIVGQYYPTSGQTGSYKNAGIDLVNCHVAAQMDVYNDVCGNYMYYAYRYAGMLIGSVRENETIDGRVYPKMDGITASNCTVHYGTWNHYYYCEFVKNGHPSYATADEYKFSRVPESELVRDDDGNVIGCTHDHTAVEDNRAIYLPFYDQLVTGYGWGVTSKGIADIPGVRVLDREIANSVEKFETKFTGDFLYRVGNQNTVSVGSLFEAAAYRDENGNPIEEDGKIKRHNINSSGVYVTVEKVNENSNVSGTFTPSTTKNSDGSIKWEDGKIQFSGTGVVKVTIQDYDFCKPTVLMLEVVDAKNATSATSATANNVVLLNDCGFSSLEVSNGYSLYGNGFTMTCGSDSASLSFGQFVELNNGTLDNVQIVCPNYDYAALYSSQLKDTDANRYETTNGTTRYYNAKSAVLATGNSQILNSRISGGRAALYTANGNIVVDNSRLEGGAVATVIIGAANSFVFRDTTLIQQPTASTYDSSKVLMGMSVLYLCDAEGKATPTKLEGSFVQNAWADSSCTAYMPTGTSSIADTVLRMDDYTHNVNNKKCVNLGFAYMPNDGTTVSKPNNITDNRTDKDSIPYSYANVNASVPQGGFNVNINTYVYTYGNSNSTSNSFTDDTGYESDKYSDIITVSYSDTAEGLTSGKSYGTDGWVYELNVDLDKLSGYALDFSKLSMTVNGAAVPDFKVDGNTKPTTPIAVAAGGTTYTLTTTIDGKEYKVIYTVTGVETSKRAPYLVDANGSEISAEDVHWGAGVCVTGTSGFDTVYSGAAPVLDGISVKYWSVSEGEYKKINLQTLVPTTSGKQNGTNNYWEYSDPTGDFTLKISNDRKDRYMHSSKKLYGMPVVYNKNLYFTVSDSSGMVSTGSGAREIVIDYVFTDNNGGELKFDHTWSVAYTTSGAVSYSAMCGDSSGSSTCVTSDTLVTLADGTQKRIDELTYDDELLVWDFYNGEYTSAPISIIYAHEEMVQPVLHLNFSDGTTVKVISSHGFFDTSANNFVYISEENVSEFIGHKFVKENNGNYAEVTLKSFEVIDELTTAYWVQTAVHNNAVTEGILSITTPDYEGWFDYFNINDDMKYDEKHMQAEIAKYGLTSYDELSYLGSYETYIALNAQYLNILIGRGVVTMEEILELFETYI